MGADGQTLAVKRRFRNNFGSILKADKLAPAFLEFLADEPQDLNATLRDRRSSYSEYQDQQETFGLVLRQHGRSGYRVCVAPDRHDEGKVNGRMWRFRQVSSEAVKDLVLPA